MAGRKLMSLEAAMEEERQQIEALLSQQPSRGPPSIGRSPSPFMSPRSPVRSMLDVGGPSAAKKSPPQVRSMLDVDSTATPKARSPGIVSAQTSPTLAHRVVAVPPADIHHRSMSDASTKPVFTDLLGPRSPPLPRDRNVDLTTDYKFSDIYATNVGQALPGSRRAPGTQHRSGSIGEALRGADLSNIVLPGEHGRSSFFRGNSKSKSPHNRLNLRSNSPHANLLRSSSSRNRDDGTITLEDGTIIDKNSAYRRLSDANLAFGGSSLSSLPRKKSDPEGHGRIEKSNMSPYGEILTDDSDDDVVNSSDEEDHRGRKLTTRADSHTSGTSDPSRGAKSLLASVEDERKHIASQPQYRSLLDPEITITSPNGEKAKKSGKRSVQPSTSFDQDPPTRAPTPDPNADQDDQDVNAIKRAQDLGISSTPIITTPEVHRSIRILYRGEFARIQQLANEENRRLRKYLVAMDLSDESTHALEWAVGTVLRDGDTLIAFYCMDEEASGSIDPGSQVPDDPKSMREQAAVVNSLAKSTKPPLTGSPHPFNLSRSSMSPLVRTVEANSNTPSPAPSYRGKSRLEEERERAVQDISDRVAKLLRKTQLEVRVIIECIHCKNPKHLITEVIDLVSPTLVILGSRGRSALKGTLLGSFSNYLVTKSSAPVMVARKRLRKKSKYQPPPRQINNLSNPSARSLETARID